MMPTLPDRIERKIEPEPMSGCWLWTGKLAGVGYGYVRYRGREHRAHRLIYLLMRGPIPEGLDLDHLCRVRSCVNPQHVEPVSRRDNLLRGRTLTRAHADATHCPAGHHYIQENIYYRADGSRQCRECIRSRDRRRSDPHRAVAWAPRRPRPRRSPVEEA